MKDYDVIYRYGSYKSCNEEFAHPYFDFYVQSKGEYAHHDSLFTLEYQTNATEKMSILKAYAPRIQSLDVDSYYIEETMRLLKKIAGIRTVKHFDKPFPLLFGKGVVNR